MPRTILQQTDISCFYYDCTGCALRACVFDRLFLKDVIFVDFEIKKQLEAARKITKIWGSLFDFAGREAQIAELEQQVAEPNFWDNPDEAQQVIQKITGLRSKIEQFNGVKTLVEDAETLYEMCKEMGDDEELLAEAGEATE